MGAGSYGSRATEGNALPSRQAPASNPDGDGPPEGSREAGSSVRRGRAKQGARVVARRLAAPRRRGGRGGSARSLRRETDGAEDGPEDRRGRHAAARAPSSAAADMPGWE